MGLQAIEQIEVIAAELAAQVFNADFAEIRVASGAMANLYGFMATCSPGDSIIVPPASIGGHVTHHLDGCAGLYGLNIHEAPVLVDGFTIDPTGLAELADRVHPALITIGGSLNLFEHPVAQVRNIADRVGAKILFDAAHQCGMIAGKQWSNPLDEGADIMTMSTYKSLGGPAAGLVVTNDAQLAEKIDSIAFPGMTANFDASKTAALAVTMLDWQAHGQGYAKTMREVSIALAQALLDHGVALFQTPNGATDSHQFAVLAKPYGGGQRAAKHIEKAGFLTCGIGLPIEPIEGDMNGLRIGTPELVRWGFTQAHVPRLARLLSEALSSSEPEALATEVGQFRREFRSVHFVT